MNEAQKLGLKLFSRLQGSDLYSIKPSELLNKVNDESSNAVLIF